MRAISLFSGVGGLDYGFALAGIETVLQVENDPICQKVLATHWPEVQRFGDVREIDPTALPGGAGDVVGIGGGPDAERLGPALRRRQHDAHGGGDPGTVGAGRDVDPACISDGGIDLIYGGFPCQDVSVAGRRAGLSGERSSLYFEFERIMRVLRPRWLVIENVPGLLSSHGGRDFLRILAGLEQLGYGLAWRILDARWFGTPQRRRRVFIVGCLGNPAGAAQVLAVCESCGGYPEARQETWQDVAYSLAASARGTGDGHGNAWNSTYIPDHSFTLPSEHRGIGNAWNHNYVAATLSGGGHPDSNLPGRHAEDDSNLVVGSLIDEGMARPLVARGTGYRMDLESETFVIANTVQSGGHSTNPLDETLLADPITTREGKTYSHEGRNNFRLRNVVAFKPSYYTRGKDGAPSDQYPALSADADKGDQDPLLAEEQGVRRLTPLECERLQGFPDGWTAGHVDSHRYRMLGNAVDTVVAQWLGHRLVRVEELL